MCGIAGIFSRKQNGFSYEPHIIRMTNAMAHRGPDNKGYLSKPEDGIFLGHRRLAIIDLSEEAAQPMWDFEKRYALSYNGEIYNYRELRKKITDYPYATQSDSEVILAAYRLWGPEAIKYFNGIFALAIWDDREKTLFVARDQLGVKPIYYYCSDEILIFASEIRSVLTSGLVQPVLNKSALTEYLTYQSNLRNRTLVENINRLEAGTYLMVDKLGLQKVNYWNILKEHDFEYPDEKSVKEKVREKMFTAVQRQMVSDVPISAFLSGGIDSGILVAAMALQSEQPINTYTITFSEKKFDESKLALLVAKRYKTNHHEVLTKVDDIVSRIPGIVSKMDNPSGDGINSFIVSEAIKNAGIKVAISGLGGDELFAGYGYASMYKKIVDQNGLWSHTSLIRNTLSGFIPKKKSGKWNKIGNLLKVNKPAFHNLYPVLRSVFSGDEISGLIKYSNNGKNSFQAEMALEEKAFKKFPVLSQFGIGDLLGYTEGVLLKDSDQMSMANSIELRVPFLDVDLVEYTLGIPDKYKNPTSPKKLLVDAMYNLIPEEIWNRKKMGFTLPWEYWMRHELSSYCGAAIINLSKRDSFVESQLLQYWTKFLNGDKSVSWAKIWTLVVLEGWIEQVLEKEVYA